VTNSPMPLPELRQRLRNQILHRGLSKREISLKNLPNARNTKNKVTMRIMNFRPRLVKYSNLAKQSSKDSPCF
jgi:hypothetical protein